MNSNSLPELGDEVRDKVSGYVGIMTSRTEFLNGCVRCGVQMAHVTDDGKIPDQAHCDIEQIEVVAKATPEIAEIRKLPETRTGGDRLDPPSRPNQ